MKNGGGGGGVYFRGFLPKSLKYNIFLNHFYILNNVFYTFNTFQWDQK